MPAGRFSLKYCEVVRRLLYLCASAVKARGGRAAYSRLGNCHLLPPLLVVLCALFAGTSKPIMSKNVVDTTNLEFSCNTDRAAILWERSLRIYSNNTDGWTDRRNKVDNVRTIRVFAQGVSFILRGTVEHLS